LGGRGEDLLISHIRTFSLCSFSEIPQDSTTAGSAVSMLWALMSLSEIRQYPENVQMQWIAFDTAKENRTL
jgi:hypothetical protein